MKKAYLKNLSGLLAKDGVEPENIELVLSWANYQPLHLSGNLNRVTFEKIMENDSSRLISLFSWIRNSLVIILTIPWEISSLC